MSVWVELRCDWGGLRCLSRSGDALVSGMAKSGANVQVVIARMHETARRSGWIKQRGVGWVCPACARLREAAPSAAAA